MVHRPPEIDDLEAPLQQAAHLLRWEVALHARNGRRSRLVDVHLRDGLPLIRRIGDARAPAANGYAENNVRYRDPCILFGTTHCGRRERRGWRLSVA